jgi:hypothetical protein
MMRATGRGKNCFFPPTVGRVMELFGRMPIFYKAYKEIGIALISLLLVSTMKISARAMLLPRSENSSSRFRAGSWFTPSCSV